MAQERQDLGMTLPALGVIVAAIVGQYLITSTGEAPRHREPFTLHRTATGDERVPARLWQDPLAAVHRYVEVLQERKQVARGEAIRKQVRNGDADDPYRWILYREAHGRLYRGERVRATSDESMSTITRVFEHPARIVERQGFGVADDESRASPKLMILGVMVDGRGTPEAGERRRRQRQAVISALGVEGFVPVGAEHLALIEVIERDPDMVNARADPNHLGPLVPFEWMRFDGVLGRGKVGPSRRGTLPERVLICWLDESHFGARAERSREREQQAHRSEGVPHVTDLFEALLRDTIEELHRKSPESDASELLGRAASLRLLGPAQSESLLPLIHRLTMAPPDPVRQGGLGDLATEMPLHVATQSLVRSLGEFLDFGLPELSNEALSTIDAAVRAFAEVHPNPPAEAPEFAALRERFSEALNAASELDAVVDSDAAWRSTAGYIAVDALLPGAARLNGEGGSGIRRFISDLMQSSPATTASGTAAGSCIVPSLRTLEPTAAVAEMAHAITNYLDHPLSDPQVEALARALKSVDGLGAALANSNARAGARRQLARVLCEQLPGVRDSEASWPAVVVRNWDDFDRWFDGFQGLDRSDGVGALEGLRRGASPLEATAHDPHLRAAIEEQLRVYSPRATLSLALSARRRDVTNWLEKHPDHVRTWQATRDDSPVALLFEQEGRPQVVPTVTEDHHTALALVDELARRGVDICFDDSGGGDHVVLLSEWDTIYGRSLPVVFEAAARFRASIPAQPEPCAPPEFARAWDRELDEFLAATDAAQVRRANAWLGDEPSIVSGPIHRFRYLRGLDGELPEVPDAVVPRSDSEAGSTGSGAKRSDSALDVEQLLEDPGLAEHAVGRSQQDQLLRMARKLSELDAELRRNGGRLGAVGVLGSDVYDKLVIIRALRDRFPGAIFFTTGADARFLHRDHYEANRNLLIASSYGLWLAESLQGATPPFRDGYQASDFLACLLALSTGDRRDELEARVKQALARPRLFEVGRDGLVDLSPPDAEAGIHPEPERRAPFDGVGGRVAAVLLCWLLFLAAVWPSLRTWVREYPSRALGLGALWFVSMAVFVGFMRASITSADGEPFRLAAGVSVWPGEALRAVALVLSVTFMIRTRHVLSDGIARLEQKFGLQSSVGASPGTVEAHWAEWTATLSSRRGWVSVLGSSLLFCGGVLALMWWLGFPWTPARGPLARGIDRFLDWGGLFALAALTLCIVRVTRRCAQCVAQVAATDVQWGKRAERSAPTQASSEDGQTTQPQLDASAATFGLKRRWLHEHTTLALVDRLTHLVGELLHYPFWIGLLLLLARHRAFDAWQTSPAFTLALCSMAGIALYAGVHLLRTAREARTRLIGRMQEHLYDEALKGKSEPRRRFKRLLRDTLEARGGAFTGWASNPVIRAILIPSSGLSLVTLLEAMLAGTRG